MVPTITRFSPRVVPAIDPASRSARYLGTCIKQSPAAGAAARGGAPSRLFRCAVWRPLPYPAGVVSPCCTKPFPALTRALYGHRIGRRRIGTRCFLFTRPGAGAGRVIPRVRPRQHTVPAGTLGRRVRRCGYPGREFARGRPKKMAAAMVSRARPGGGRTVSVGCAHTRYDVILACSSSANSRFHSSLSASRARISSAVK